NPDGTVDNSFGTAGIVNTDMGEGDAGIESIALQSDGKIIAVGHTTTVYYSGTSASFHLPIVRYNSDGTLDNTFNGKGVVFDRFPDATFADAFHSVAVQPDGKILAAGSYEGSGFLSELALARYNSDGTPDTTFNGTGKIAPGTPGGMYSMALAQDGEIVLGGP